MGSRVNIGSFRDRIKVYFIASQANDDLGGSVIDYENYTINAHVEQLDSNQALRLGLDLLNDNYKVVCRPPTNSRPIMVDYNGESFRVISAVKDKVNKFMTLTITKNG
jgi:hypothetical protein